MRSTPFALSRMPVLGRRGAVATAHPLATQAGLAMLHRGGNAVDAVIAMAAALVVVEPTSNGLGSDAYALLWDGQRMRAINGSGRAPKSLTIDTVLGQPRRGKSAADRPRAWGPDVMPELGWLSVTVPGAVALWRDLHRECGRLDFAELLAPAISLAEGGFAVSPVVGRRWRASADAYAPLVGDPVHRGWFDTFAPTGPPVDGQMVVFGDHAESLRELAASGGDSLYTGRLAERVASFSEATGAFIAADDLTSHTSTWVAPISVSFRGHDVWELPPNSTA